MEFNCEMLGISQEEMQDRVINAAAEKLLSTSKIMSYDDDDFGEVSTPFSKAMQAFLIKSVNEKVNEIAERELLPRLDTIIEETVFQQTKKWGEKVGEERTVTEYLRDSCRAYLKEQVDGSGKPQPVKDDYNRRNWRGEGSRIDILVNGFLEKSLAKSMNGAIEDANKAMADSIQETMTEHLTKLLATFKVNVAKKKTR